MNPILLFILVLSFAVDTYKEPTIDAMLINNYDFPLIFIGCDKMFGSHHTKIKRILPLAHIQRFHITTTPVNNYMISGRCYYIVPVNETHAVPLQLQYYKNTQSGHEYYGMLNSEHYNVLIMMPYVVDALYIIT